MSRFDEATLRQVAAADPRRSSWVSANAGSGKTRVLTDRVARLLLLDVPPQNVLCLTYTKAAASEMQNRLFARLGEWAMLDDAELREKMDRLGITEALDEETLRRARRLFARAIETPGGLKIQTIHSFCASILRRFPLEAGVNPGFTELDGTAATALQTAVLDEIAQDAPLIYAEMAALVSDPDLTGIAARIAGLRYRGRFPKTPDRATVLAQFSLPPDANSSTIRAEAIPLEDRETIAELADALDGMTATTRKVSAACRALIAGFEGPHRFDDLADLLLKKSDGRPKANILSAKRRSELGPLEDAFDILAESCAAVRDRLAALGAAEKTLNLHHFAAVFLPLYARRKEEGGWLDFDDQIEKARDLLAREGVAEWVLYRLDGSIDHVLVDEAQDTSPLQWEVIDLLTREFTSGAGTTEAGQRTIFVVGDPKQSIYSFQGADPAGFQRMRSHFDADLAHLGLALQKTELTHSFRSAATVLETVDGTFPPENRHGLEETVHHIAFKSELPGRVDLWPLVPVSETEDPGDWEAPVDSVAADHHVKVHAERVAAKCREMVDSGFLWEEVDKTYRTRPVNEGDILILVQGRGAGSHVSLFQEIIRACKGRGLLVAGADVLKLGEELAVRDILSALAFLSTSEDDLSLAEILRSPLLGWTEDALFELAAARPGRSRLWEALRKRRDEFPETMTVLDDLRSHAEFLRPYDLIERLLTVHGARRKLVARLGEEAADGVDALLAQALAYEQTEPPSLSGFLARMEGADLNVKRQAEGRGSKLRVMTVHGAKGLESPIVILPDAGHRQMTHRYTESLIIAEDGPPLWPVPKAESPQLLEALKQEAVERREEESQRLLYVAMTRAEQWLIVGAAGDLKTRGDSWYEQVREGLVRCGAEPIEIDDETGLRLQSSHWDDARPPDQQTGESRQTVASPEWLQSPVSAPDRPLGAVSPSDLGGAKALPGEGGLVEAEAMARGSRIHLLLEHLPSARPAEWPRLAERLLGPDTPPQEVPALLDEAQRILTNDSLSFLFAPDTLAEVDVIADLPGTDGRRIHGKIDRLVVRQNNVLAVDFKTNAAVPENAVAVPEGLLRQMGAYAVALKQIFPDRKVETAILWTATGQLMSLPDGLVHEAVNRFSPP